MAGSALTQLAQDIASVLPEVDSQTTGQYGAGIGSEDEEQQVELLLEALRSADDVYAEAAREVPYPSGEGSCDLVLADETAIECKLLRYWRANGDSEDYMWTHVFSPFHRHTLLTDANRLHAADFAGDRGLLGLFYKRGDDDPEQVSNAPEQYTAQRLARKVVEDIDYWYGIDAEVAAVAPFEGLQHTVHQQGAAITWEIERSSS